MVFCLSYAVVIILDTSAASRSAACACSDDAGSTSDNHWYGPAANKESSPAVVLEQHVQLWPSSASAPARRKLTSSTHDTRPLRFPGRGWAYNYVRTDKRRHRPGLVDQDASRLGTSCSAGFKPQTSRQGVSHSACEQQQCARAANYVHMACGRRLTAPPGR